MYNPVSCATGSSKISPGSAIAWLMIGHLSCHLRCIHLLTVRFRDVESCAFCALCTEEAPARIFIGFWAQKG